MTPKTKADEIHDRISDLYTQRNETESEIASLRGKLMIAESKLRSLDSDLDMAYNALSRERDREFRERTRRLRESM